jgi:hypothetical protein
VPFPTIFLLTVFVFIFNWVPPSKRKHRSFQLDHGKPLRFSWRVNSPPSLGETSNLGVGTKCQAKHRSQFTLGDKVNSLFQKKHIALSQISIFHTLHYLPDKKKNPKCSVLYLQSGCNWFTFIGIIHLSGLKT